MSRRRPVQWRAQSLELAKGGEAATPAMCVNLNNPTIRFFTRDVGGNGKANLKIDVLYEGLDGNVKHLTVAKVKAGGDLAAVSDHPDVHEHARARIADRCHGCRLSVQSRRSSERRNPGDLEHLRRSLLAPLMRR